MVNTSETAIESTENTTEAPEEHQQEKKSPTRKRRTPRVPAVVTEAVKAVQSSASEKDVNEETLKDMYNQVLHILKGRLLNPNITASELSVVLKVLADNGISSIRKKGNGIDQLANAVENMNQVAKFPFAPGTQAAQTPLMKGK